MNENRFLTRRVLAFLAIALFGRSVALRAAPFELAIRDNIGKTWLAEPICWHVELPQGAWKGDGDGRTTRDTRPISSQATVVQRHGDGSARQVEVRLIIDHLAKHGSTKIAWDPLAKGPADTDLRIEKTAGALVLANDHAAIKVIDRNVKKADSGEFSPILGVRTRSGKWTSQSSYDTRSARPVGSTTELIEDGPVRLAARVTTTFDNGRTHKVLISLGAGSRAIDLEESFDLGPDEMYRFKQYANDRDELSWEWWSWYGDMTGEKETHPNYWIVPLSSDAFQPAHVRYRGEASTDQDKGDTSDRGESQYKLSFAKERRLEKYLAGHGQWRPDAVTWYAVSANQSENDDVVAVLTHSVRNWRNPNVHPLNQNTTLRTGANDMRIMSASAGRQLSVACPIGMGRRTWAIRVSTVAESFAARDASPSALSAEIIQRNLGLDVTRQWITDWKMTFDYPRLFIKPGQREAYYKRAKGVGVGLPGHNIDYFLKDQDQTGFDRLWKEANDAADRMIAGYFTHGLDNTNNYPGWMLGYWHGTIVACNLDNLLGSPLCTRDQARSLKQKLAILTYCLTSRDAWSDKQINYGWGSMNMPVGRWGGLVVMASANSDHPLAKTWLKDAGRYFRTLLATEYSPDGVHISCPHYIGASLTSFYAWIALANSGMGEDVSQSESLRKFARYYMQLMTPIDPRWGIRTLNTEGDSRPGSSPLPGILATFFRDSDPELAGQLMRIWIDGGRDVSQGMGVPDSLIIDGSIEPRRPQLGPQVFPGFGAVLRYRELGTPAEAYLTMLAGNFMIDHTNADQLAFCWYEKGVPLTLYQGDMYVPGAMSALSHNTLAWDVRPDGPPTPGKDKPGDWYHDHGVPWVEHVNRPRLHWQIGLEGAKQSIRDTRGRTTLAVDAPGAALVEGQVKVHALTEVPTRADYSTAIQPQSKLPARTLAEPFIWTRRLVYVKDEKAAGMNYLVVRDDTGKFDEFVPSFNYWSLANHVKLDNRRAKFAGQLGVDTDLVVLQPSSVKLFQDVFEHDQCEGAVAARHNGPFREKQVLCRIEGKKGQGFLVVLFPRRAEEEPPTVAPWADGNGAKITWMGQTHYVLLDVVDRKIDEDGIRGRASALVVKGADPTTATVELLAGETIRVGDRRFTQREEHRLKIAD